MSFLLEKSQFTARQGSNLRYRSGYQLAGSNAVNHWFVQPYPDKLADNAIR